MNWRGFALAAIPQSGSGMITNWRDEDAHRERVDQVLALLVVLLGVLLGGLFFGSGVLGWFAHLTAALPR